MFCLGIFLPRDQRTKLVGWHFVDNPSVISKPSLANGETKESTQSKRPQVQVNQRCLPLRKLGASARSSLYRILENFASREDEDDADSVDRFERHVQQDTSQKERHQQEAPGSYPPGRTEAVSCAAVSKDGLVAKKGLASRFGVDLNKPFELNSAKSLIGEISDKDYRKDLLNMTEKRLQLWVHQSSPPSAAARDLLCPLPPSPRSDLKGLILRKEWEALKDYVYFLNTKVVHIEQLWQTYTEALLMFGWYDLAREGEDAYEAIYGRST